MIVEALLSLALHVGAQVKTGAVPSPVAICRALHLEPRLRTDGSVRSCVTLDGRGIPDGPALRFFPSGALALVGTLKGDAMVATWVAYLPTGDVFWRGRVVGSQLEDASRAHQLQFKMHDPRWLIDGQTSWCSPPVAAQTVGDVHSSSESDCDRAF